MNIETKIDNIEKHVTSNIMLASDQIMAIVGDLLKTKQREVINFDDKLTESFINHLIEKGSAKSKYGLYCEHNCFPIYYDPLSDLLDYFNIKCEWNAFTDNRIVLCNTDCQKTFYSIL